MLSKQTNSRLAAALLLLLTLTVPLALPQGNAPGAAPAGQAATTAAPRDERLWREALRIHRKAIVVDTHNDITSMMIDEDYDLATPSAGKYHTDLARMKQGGLTAEFFSIYVDKKYATAGGSARRALDQIDLVYRAAERYPNAIMMATSVEDIRRAKKQGKLAALMGIEGGHAIENSLMALRDFYRLGVRYMTLTHNNTNDWADSSRDVARHNGLTDFGKEVVREMNRLGMLVDVSHVSDKTMSDVLDVSTAPIIASHSSARALSNHPRNIPDELLLRIARNGGVVMVNFYPVFIDQRAYDADRARDVRLKPQLDELGRQFKDDPKRLDEERKKLFDANPLPPTPLSVLIDHIDHIAKVAGVDHVGIGSDFDGVPRLPEGMKDISELPNITYELLRRGYKEKDIRKILGENLLRVFAQAERTARTSSRNISAEGSLRRN
ncbi:MAG TPA: dipeptidase [Pyrinomonadaceae bacterium]|jgi:membrane dipeptidase